MTLGHMTSRRFLSTTLRNQNSEYVQHIKDTSWVQSLVVPNQQFVSTLPHFQDGFVQNVHIPIVRVDPENRCAVMLIYGTKLVVLPFRKDTLTDEQELGVGEGCACSL